MSLVLILPFVSQDVEKDGDVVTISTVAQFEKAKADVVLMLDLGQQMYTSMTYSVQYSLAANMQRAGMNTLMGIGIVFLMLVFLSFVIGLFKYIEKFQNVGKKKAAEEAPKAEEAACTGQSPRAKRQMKILQMTWNW